MALALGGGRIAGAVFDADRQAHVADWFHQVTLDIDGKRFQRRDVEGVDTGEGGTRRDLSSLRQRHQRRQEPGQRLAGAGRRDQEHVFAALDAGEKLQLMCTRLPALLREPAQEGWGQEHLRL